MIIVDVREPAEYRMEHVEGALNVPLSLLLSGAIGQLEEADRDTQLVVYCRSGGRSQTACNLLKSHGFTALRNGINKGEVENQWCDA